MTKKRIKFNVFFEQINAMCYEVRAEDREKAVRRAKKLWMEDYGYPPVDCVERG